MYDNKHVYGYYSLKQEQLMYKQAKFGDLKSLPKKYERYLDGQYVTCTTLIKASSFEEAEEIRIKTYWFDDYTSFGIIGHYYINDIENID